MDVGYFQPPKEGPGNLSRALENPLARQLCARAARLEDEGLRAILHILDVIDEYRSEKQAGAE